MLVSIIIIKLIINLL